MGKGRAGNNTREVIFTSPSLSYRSTSVEVKLRDASVTSTSSVNWSVGGHPFYSTSAHKLYGDLLHSVSRTTIYELDDGLGSAGKLRLCSPEHLAPVFLMWPDRIFDVNIVSADEPEVPMMDGSALPFFSRLRREAGVPHELSFYDVPLRAEWDLCRHPGEAPTGCVRITPSEAFEVEYVLDSVGSSVSVSIYSAEDLFSVFMARTFITEKDYREAREAGLLAGVDESCGLLLPDGSANKNLYRVDEEPARHKVLDLLGDLAFVCPSLPKVRIEILNGGHVSHHQIVRRLLPYVSLRIPSQVR